MQPLFNLETEKYILGALILEKHEDIHLIDESDFYSQELRTIFKVIKWLAEKKKQIDTISVADWSGKKLNNAYELIIECTDTVATLTAFKSNLERLKLYSTKRALLKKAKEIEMMVHDSVHDTSLELKTDALEKIGEIKAIDDETNLISLKDLIAKTVNEIEEEYRDKKESQLLTGFTKLDNILAGFHRQELTILAARPAAGKTAFALNLITNLVARGNNCLFVSREMSDVQLCKRLISSYSGLDGNKIRQAKYLSDKDWIAISKSMDHVYKISGDVYIDDKILTIEQIRMTVRRLKNKEKIDIVFVDYLGLVKTSKKCESHRLEVEHVSWNLKQISKEFNIPVVALCQLNRAPENSNEEPQLHHLRETGAIEQDADNVLMLHIDKNEKDNPCQNVKVLVRKQRNGPTGGITLKCYKNTFKYYDN